MLAKPGYYSTWDAIDYITLSGSALLVGDIDTMLCVWEPCVTLPDDAEPSILDPDFAEELERSRVEHGIA